MRVSKDNDTYCAVSELIVPSSRDDTLILARNLQPRLHGLIITAAESEADSKSLALDCRHYVFFKEVDAIAFYNVR